MGKDIIDRYVEPHTKISRDVTEKDLKRVAKESLIMMDLCHLQIGVHKGARAIAHSQIDDKDPLRFFVMRNGAVIVNPVIIRHTRHTVDSKEGCMSYPDDNQIIVQRYNKCEVQYRFFDGKDLGHLITENLSSINAKIFQHEIDHFDCIDIFHK